MSSFRDHKRRARRQLHQRMNVPALFLMAPDTLPEDAIPVTIRLHTKWDALGDQKGTSLNSAEMESLVPKAILMLDQLPFGVRDLPRTAILSVEIGEAYRIDHAEEPDDISVTVHIVRLSAEKAQDLPVPENG